jgi:hypothetical protein
MSDEVSFGLNWVCEKIGSMQQGKVPRVDPDYSGDHAQIWMD